MMKQAILGLVLALSFVLGISQVSISAEPQFLFQEGFEETPVGSIPEGWVKAVESMQNKRDVGNFEVTTDVAKTGEKSLKVFGKVNSYLVAAPLAKDVSIISVEFWFYIDAEGRAFSLLVTPAPEEQRLYKGAAYIIFFSGEVKAFHDFAGREWAEHQYPTLGKYEIGKWNYVRVVVDFNEQLLDFYMGDSREEVLKSEPLMEGFSLRSGQIQPVATWVAFWLWDTTIPGYVDDVIAYEGAEPFLPETAVEPIGKLVTIWGKLKG